MVPYHQRWGPWPEGMAALVDECVAERVWAVVGASRDARKFGHRITLDLHRAGYTVYPVNPQGGMIDGIVIYPTLAALPERPAVVDVVVPPAVGAGILRECAALGIRRVWLQPGAESPELIALGERLGLKVVHHACIMLEKRRWEVPPA
jgi:predicted CoA-binding protein